MNQALAIIDLIGAVVLIIVSILLYRRKAASLGVVARASASVGLLLAGAQAAWFGGTRYGYRSLIVGFIFSCNTCALLGNTVGVAQMRINWHRC